VVQKPAAAPSKTTNPLEPKKKRGRKAAVNYLSTAQTTLEEMRTKYEQEKKKLAVKERAKHRNRISALESRIKKR